jgi:hypothetical protein
MNTIAISGQDTARDVIRYYLRVKEITDAQHIFYTMCGQSGLRLDKLKEFESLGEQALSTSLTELRRFVVDSHLYLEEYLESYPIILLLYLGHKRKGFDLLCQILKFPNTTNDIFFDLMITEEFQWSLYLTFDGNNKALEEIISNSYLDPYCRDAALRCLNSLYVTNKLGKDYIVGVYKSLFDDLLVKEKHREETHEFIYCLISAAMDLAIPEFYSDSKALLDLDIIDPQMLPMSELDSSFALSEEKASEVILKEVKEREAYSLIEALGKYMQLQEGSDEEEARKKRNKRKRENRKS